jgi:hypothetical protein
MRAATLTPGCSGGSVTVFLHNRNNNVESRMSATITGELTCNDFSGDIRFGSLWNSAVALGRSIGAGLRSKIGTIADELVKLIDTRLGHTEAITNVIRNVVSKTIR